MLIAISLVAAALVTMKVSSAIFLLLPATSIFSLLLKRRLRIRQPLVPLAVFVTTAAALSFRYIVFHKQASDAFRVMMNDLKAWQNVLGTSPRFFYSWDIFIADGRWFLILVGISFIVLALNAVRRRRADEISVLMWTLFFSIAGLGLLKYSRGGYHLAVLYLAGVIMAVGALRRWLNPRPIKGLLGIVCAICLLPTLYVQGAHYAGQRNRMTMLADATRLIRTEPREWMQTHAKPGARVTIPIHSEWALPPIFDMGFETGYRFLMLPYTDPVALEKCEPPEIGSIAGETDFVVLNDFHPPQYMYVLRKLGFDALAARWERFFKDLVTNFHVVEFSSPSDSYGIRSIRIIIVNPDGLRGDE
jgi:hypothetical protein